METNTTEVKVNSKQKKTKRVFSFRFRRDIAIGVKLGQIDINQVIDPAGGKPIARALVKRWVFEFAGGFSDPRLHINNIESKEKTKRDLDLPRFEEPSYFIHSQGPILSNTMNSPDTIRILRDKISEQAIKMLELEIENRAIRSRFFEQDLEHKAPHKRTETNL